MKYAWIHHHIVSQNVQNPQEFNLNSQVIAGETFNQDLAFNLFQYDLLLDVQEIPANCFIEVIKS